MTKAAVDSGRQSNKISPGPPSGKGESLCPPSAKRRGLSGTVFIAAFCLCFLPPAVIPAQNTNRALPAATSGQTQPGAPVKGIVQKVYPELRKIVINGTMYFLSPTLVVKNKKGEVLPKFKVAYLSWAHRIEFVSVNYVISEIKIVQNAS